MGDATFKQTYGTNADRSNAMGKCVSKRTAATNAARRAAKGHAAKAAKTVNAQVAHDIHAARQKSQDAAGS